MTVQEIIVLTASYYRIPLSEPVLAMYCEDLADLSADAVIAAYKAYRRDSKNRTMPLPAQIRDIVEPAMTHDAEAREILGRIKKAIKDFGGHQGSEARMAIGPAGWQCVNEMGGWFNLCFAMDIFNDGVLQAQARERLIDIMKHGVNLRSVDRPALPPPEMKIQIERDSQKARIEQWVLDDIDKNKKPDPNELYLQQTPEERDQMLKDFIARVNAKRMP